MMKYVAILGLDYKDCKGMLDSLKREPETLYTLVTKVKHTNGLEFVETIDAPMAKKNPQYKQINRAIKSRKVSKPKVPVIKEVPVVEEDIVVEEYNNDDIDWKSEENFPVEPIEIDEEFEKELEALIEKDEDVKEEVIFTPEVEEPMEPMIEPLGEPEAVTEPVEETPAEVPVIDHVEELTLEEPVETSVEEEPVVEEEIAPEPEAIVEEVPEPEPVVEEEIAPIKPVNRPRGWQARNEFIDDNGNIFKKGKYVGNVND